MGSASPPQVVTDRTMATILAYGSPALGHLLPVSALLREIADRGHEVHLRTHAGGVAAAERLGLHAAAVDPRIEAITGQDWTARGGYKGRRCYG